MGKQTEKGSKCTSKNPKNRIIPPNSLVCPPRKKICKGAKKLKKRLAFSARKGYYIVNFHSPAQGRGESKIFKRVENMKQSKLLKKSLAALLAILMVAAMIPMSAFAAEAPDAPAEKPAYIESLKLGVTTADTEAKD